MRKNDHGVRVLLIFSKRASIAMADALGMLGARAVKELFHLVREEPAADEQALLSNIADAFSGMSTEILTIFQNNSLIMVVSLTGFSDEASAEAAASEANLTVFDSTFGTPVIDVEARGRLIRPQCLYLLGYWLKINCLCDTHQSWWKNVVAKRSLCIAE